MNLQCLKSTEGRLKTTTANLKCISRFPEIPSNTLDYQIFSLLKKHFKQTKKNLLSNLTLFPLGLHEDVWHGFRSTVFWLRRSPWKALMCWLMKGCRPSFSRSRHRPAFSQFLYSLSLRRTASSSRTIAALFPDVKHSKRERASLGKVLLYSTHSVQFTR